MIEYQLPRTIMKYSKCLSYPTSILCNQMIIPFLNSSISANHDKLEENADNVDGEILINGIETYFEH